MPRSVDPVNEKMRVARLFNTYGQLLSERQKKFIDLHCNEDLSLSEIAQGEGISRQAVFDAIKQGKKRLTRFESVLHLCGEEKEEASGEAIPSLGQPTDHVRRIRVLLNEIESLTESGVVYDTRNLREKLEEIRRLLG